MLGVVQWSSTADSREAGGSPREKDRAPWIRPERGDRAVLAGPCSGILI